MRPRKVLVASVLAVLALSLPSTPIHAQAPDTSSDISPVNRYELYAINCIRDTITIHMENMIDTADHMISNLYSYAMAIADKNAELASGWRALLEDQYASLLASREQIFPFALQIMADSSASLSASIEANNLLTPTELVQGLDTLVSGLAYSTQLLEGMDPKWSQYHQEVGGYMTALRDHVKRYNVIAGDIIRAIALDLQLPHVVTFVSPSSELPGLYVPWEETPPDKLPVAKQRSGVVPQTPSVVVLPGTLSTPAVIESYIDGEFEGWDGDTIFVLTNGQIWQQDEYSYYYTYRYRPKVLIYRNSTGGYTMRVDGVDRELRVRRLR